ncbi:MAG: stage 0 sporulation family protein [Calditrichaeota bacterium]|nr:stage 0 sporulation family protein [Calditrichota bacterium]
MSQILEIGFKGNRKEYFSNPLQFPFRVGDYAIVEADRGEDLGIILQVGILASLKGIQDESNLRKILRKPNEKDLRRYEENRALERDAFDMCKVKITAHHLQMKLVDVEYQFDRNKLTFYFTADKRVDFRELVKDLASIYRTRIELRQIGVRDEARRLGGYGPCGRQLCCTSFLHEFDPITTQHAKEQNLPLNPTKLSGVCGRLKCCLRFERDFYQKANQRFPDVGSTIKTPDGVGTVERIDILKEEVYLRINGEGITRYSLDEITNLILQGKHENVKKNSNHHRSHKNKKGVS